MLHCDALRDLAPFIQFNKREKDHIGYAPNRNIEYLILPLELAHEVSQNMWQFFFYSL